MNALVSALSDRELLARLPEVRGIERRAIAEVIAHLAEVERRRLYLAEACSSMYTFCIERLGYSENEAHTRLQVARLCSQFPEALEALETGTIHLTGLALLCPKVTEANAQELLDEARGKTRREIEALLARRFPRPDVLPSITPLQRALLEQGNSGPVTQSEQFAPTAPASPEPAPPRPRVEPLSLEPREAGHRTGPKRRRRPRRRAIASGRPGGLGLSLATASRMTVEPRCPRGSRSWATPSSGVRLVSKGAFSWRIRQ